jgi:hypothetical protein
VATARGILRELLAGPLAQNVNPQHVTDPHSVVPHQMGPAPVYAPPPAPGQKKVGGRAMLHTGETPATRRSAAGAVRHSTANYPAVEPKRKIDNKTRLAIGAGIAAVLLIVSVSFAMWDKDTKQEPQSQQKTSAPPSPSRAPGDDVNFGGMTILGPKGWKQSPNQNNSWLDILSPSDSGRRIRLSAVTAEKDAVKTLEYAQSVTLVNQCEEGLQPIEMRQAGLAGTQGMELEFMCNSKGKQRHGLWRVVRIGEAMRHVYLLTWETNFAEDKAYFETAVQSFRLV